MPDSFFREMMISLMRTENADRKPVPDWQRVLRTLLAAQVDREIAIDRHYTGNEILIDRDELQCASPASERGACLCLYKAVVGRKPPHLKIGEDSYRLIGYEVPNQYNAKGRRADFLGINSAGGLVVFEGKLANNSYGPLMAVLEGLDYLAALLHSTNFFKMHDELEERARRNQIPEVELLLDRNACHEVIVLAPAEYYPRQEKTRIQDHDWTFLNDCRLNSDPKVRIRYATTTLSLDNGFSADDCKWVE